MNYFRRTNRRTLKSVFSTSTQPNKEDSNFIPVFLEYIKKRDFSGSIAVIETVIETTPDKDFYSYNSYDDDNMVPWLAYSYFHLGRYEDSLNEYKKLLEKREEIEFYIPISCCYFYLKMYKESEECAKLAPEGPNKKRLLLSLQHYKIKKDNEIRKKQNKKKSDNSEEDGSSTEPQQQDLDSVDDDDKHEERPKLDPSQFSSRDLIDQCCLAAIHYHRKEYEEAIEIYKKLLLTHRDMCALHVYISFCYYQIGYNDISEDIIKVYLKKHPTSITAQNLKACNIYHLSEGPNAEESIMKFTQQHCSSYELQSLTIRHNLVVFRKGDQSLKILPELIDVFNVVATNLVIFYLRVGEIGKAKKLLEDETNKEKFEGIEYWILKAVVHTYLGQAYQSMNTTKPSFFTSKQNNNNQQQQQQQHPNNRDLQLAMEGYQRIGLSESECDTVKGRQSMASYYFLNRSFEDVIIYLKSIEDYFQDSDEFHWNFGIANCECNLFTDALESLKKVKRIDLKNEFLYLCYLGRCHVMTGNPEEAWNMYLKLVKNQDIRQFLLMFSNDCYRTGHFYFAAKAFSVLEKLHPCEIYWKGKRGAICGLFQKIVAGQEDRSRIKDLLVMLSKSSVGNLGSGNVSSIYSETQLAQVEEMKNLIKAWAITV